MSILRVSTRGKTVPYITVDELERNPISGQLKKLVPNTSPADRRAELKQIIRRVTAMINGECSQNLAATLDTEVGEVIVARNGDLRIHCRSNPIIQVLSLSVGPDFDSLVEITDLSNLVLDPWRITVPRGASGVTRSGNLPLGGSWRPGHRLVAQWSYVNGFPVTTLAASAAEGDTTITVHDATGIVPGQTLLAIEDGINFEYVTPTAVAGNTLTVPALEFDHTIDNQVSSEREVGVTALPDDVKEATLLLISRLHDTWSLSMGAITHDGTGARVPGAKVKRAMCDAAVMLSPYRRQW